eukprot:TRINITY_DN5338_c0_g1_i1.p1 TRINITY_DN5338_c0_g1~~TRINITY_DN5338_c0_g1_i1.p1  ORF type:complete len:565 (+),score=209.90 TRINITY_DN5338_c0_g1_i1:321-2015(+)
MVSKKRKREEKNKTQLKKPRTAPGKHLPKGTNVTKTEFRVAKIVIPGQAGAPSQGGPTTRKKLGLKEVLHKLGHFSQTVRADGLEGLKELLSAKTTASLVNSNLAFILTSLVPVTQDKERKLRRLAISLLPLVLSDVSPSLLTPLHSLLSAHLCCSLTHIDPRIQQDGLTMLDTLLDKAPGFIRSNYNFLLPNCLDQISNKKVGEKGPSVAANMTETMTALEWRVLVLTRVDRVLDTVVQEKESRISSTVNANKSLVFSPGLSCPVTSMSSPTWLPMSSLSARTTTSSMLTNLKLVMPLLVETWVEARSNENNSRKGSTLTSQVGDLLMCEAGVMDKLLVLALDNSEGGDREAVLKLVNDKYMMDIKQHFLSHMPYTSQGKSADQANALLCCISLSVTHTMEDSLLEVAVGVAASKNILSSTRLRLARILLLRSQLTVEQRDRIVLALVSMLETDIGKEKVDTLDLLREQAMQWPQAGVTSWVESLPNQLLSQVKVEQMELVLNTCLELAKTCNKSLARQFLANWHEIQGSLDNPVFKSCKASLIQKLEFIKHHCDLCIPASIA